MFVNQRLTLSTISSSFLISGIMEGRVASTPSLLIRCVEQQRGGLPNRAGVSFNINFSPMRDSQRGGPSTGAAEVNDIAGRCDCPSCNGGIVGSCVEGQDGSLPLCPKKDGYRIACGARSPAEHNATARAF